MDLKLNNPQWKNQKDSWVIGDLDHEKLLDLIQLEKSEIVSYLIKNKIENFAGIIRDNYKHICITDSVCSYPIIYNLNEGKISDSLSKNDDKKIHKKNLLLLKNSGYTLGESTIYDGWSWISPFSFFIFQDTKLTKNYYNPKKSSQLDQINYLDLLKKSINRVNTKIVLPLSGGTDSRTILSISRKLNKIVVPYTYGKKKNWDSESAKKICNFLKLKLHTLSFSFRKQRYFWKTQFCNDWLNLQNLGVSIPFYQDVFYLRFILEKQKDFIYMNGNTGDFISGKHLPRFCSDIKETELIQYLYSRYFQLWRKVDHNETIFIKKEIGKEISRLKSKYHISSSLSITYFFEWENRQSKYLMNGQRAYDLCNINWRLPFWSMELCYNHLNINLEKLLFGKVYDDQVSLSHSKLFNNKFLNITRYDVDIYTKIIRRLYKFIFHRIFFLAERENNIWKPFTSILKICSCVSYFRQVFIIPPYNVETAVIYKYFIKYFKISEK